MSTAKPMPTVVGQMLMTTLELPSSVEGQNEIDFGADTSVEAATRILLGAADRDLASISSEEQLVFVCLFIGGRNWPESERLRVATSFCNKKGFREELTRDFQLKYADLLGKLRSMSPVSPDGANSFLPAQPAGQPKKKKKKQKKKKKKKKREQQTQQPTNSVEGSVKEETAEAPDTAAMTLESSLPPYQSSPEPEEQKRQDDDVNAPVLHSEPTSTTSALKEKELGAEPEGGNEEVKKKTNAEFQQMLIAYAERNKDLDERNKALDTCIAALVESNKDLVKSKTAFGKDFAKLQRKVVVLEETAFAANSRMRLGELRKTWITSFVARFKVEGDVQTLSGLREAVKHQKEASDALVRAEGDVRRGGTSMRDLWVALGEGRNALAHPPGFFPDELLEAGHRLMTPHSGSIEALVRQVQVFNAR